MLVCLSDITDSVINIRKNLIKLRTIIKSEYKELFESSEDFLNEFEGLEEIVDKIMLESSEKEIQDDLKKKKCANLIDEFISCNEVLNCALISITGIPLINKMKKELLEISIKQMDAFWKFKNKILDQMILFYEDKYIILYKIDSNFVISVLFQNKTPVGFACLLIKEISKNISMVLKVHS